MRRATCLGMVLIALSLPAAIRAGGSCPECPACRSCGCSRCGEHVCVLEPHSRQIKKTVYDVKCVPVCEHRPSRFLAGCDCCPVCQLKYKKVLVKREVVVGETCTHQCTPVPAHCAPCRVPLEP